jgi:SOS-response transcriptional repressor LexA
MAHIEKTVFISYRRTNFYTALAIYQDLTQHGYDVFFDYQSIDSGNFANAILENIRARAHFLVVLSPSALERCNQPGDWLRREIETAMDEKRNIVPLMLEGFDFSNQATEHALTGKLSTLNDYNGLRLYADYFFEAMERIRERYLNKALDDIRLYPLSDTAKVLADKQKSAVHEAAPVQVNQLVEQQKIGYEYVYDERIRIPIVGRIGANLPSPMPEKLFLFDSEAHVEVTRSMLPSGIDKLFALVVEGDGMVDAMVNHGDVVILRKVKSNSEAKNGEMVAIWLPERDETTLKYFYKEKDGYRLQPANPTMQPIMIKGTEKLEIRGKVVMIIRQVGASSKY